MMAEQIDFFSFRRLTIGATSSFHDSVVEMVEEATPAAWGVEAVFPAYRTAVEALRSVVGRPTVFSSTVPLGEADGRRNAAVSTLLNVPRAYALSLVEEKREAAGLLMVRLGPYLRMRRRGRSQRSAEIRSLLALLAEPENAEAVRTLGMADDVESLRRAQEEYDLRFDDKVTEVVRREPVKSLGSVEAKNEARRLYHELTRTVNALAIVSPSPAVEAFVQEMNGMIAVYATIAANTGKSRREKPSDGAEA